MPINVVTRDNLGSGFELDQTNKKINVPLSLTYGTPKTLIDGFIPVYGEIILNGSPTGAYGIINFTQPGSQLLGVDQGIEDWQAPAETKTYNLPATGSIELASDGKSMKIVVSYSADPSLPITSTTKAGEILPCISFGVDYDGTVTTTIDTGSEFVSSTDSGITLDAQNVMETIKAGTTVNIAATSTGSDLTPILRTNGNRMGYDGGYEVFEEEGDKVILDGNWLVSRITSD